MEKLYEKEIDFSDPNDAHAKMIEFVGSDRRVIDFGCWTGFVSRVLKERGCYVAGIEIDPQAAEGARGVCDRVVVGDLDELDLADVLEGEKYDVGLFGDVIEHLKNPGRVLAQTREVLLPGGYIVLSVPNIAHASIRLMLLKGEFNYEETGILDDTHLKYYTRESIGDFLESCGYMVDVMEWTEQKLPESHLRAALDPLELANLEEVVKAFSTWEAVAFQYIVKAFPADEEAQVRRLSEEKIQAEKRARELEKQLSEFSDQRKELAKAREYQQKLEESIDKKGNYIEQLEAAMVERDQIIHQKDAEAALLQERIEELKVSQTRKRKH